MLASLQGNILRSHGRDFAVHLFFQVGADVEAAKQAIKRLRTERYILSSAEQSLQTPEVQEVFGTLLLSAAGLAKLGMTLPAGFGDTLKPPNTPGPSVAMRFAQPMRAAAAELGDDPSSWDAHFQTDVDGLLIVAYGNHTDVNEQAVVDKLFEVGKQARDILEPAVKVVAMETGHSHIVDKEPREHFGFVDGISQPLFRIQDLPKSAPKNFQPGSGLSSLLVADPFTDEPDAFASFFVFRKLEQNVSGFNGAVAGLAKDLGLDKPLAGAMVVGRFKNGDPVVLGAAEVGPLPQEPTSNDFVYGIDPDATKCPFQGHIRKTNPRGDIARTVGATGAAADAIDVGERGRRIARRGITYGSRAHDLSDAPSSGVGLLFMCYQANIPDQFAFMQKNWVNTDNFAPRKLEVGQDPVIGQGGHDDAQVWPLTWGGKTERALPDFGKFVTNKGGEFFVALSIPTIEAIAP